jgi:DNA-binding response OmpR family regulator
LGAAVVRELRALHPGVRIIAMSGMVDDCRQDRGEAGELVFVQKPMTGEELNRAIQSALGERPGGSSGPRPAGPTGR